MVEGRRPSTVSGRRGACATAGSPAASARRACVTSATPGRTCSQPCSRPRGRASRSCGPNEVSTTAMQAFLDRFAATLSPDEHAVVVVDQAGWHTAHALAVPDNVTLVRLPPYTLRLFSIDAAHRRNLDRLRPELNPVARRWCTELTRAGNHPSPTGVQATRAETGLAVRVMRFSTETANAASPCWRAACGRAAGGRSGASSGSWPFQPARAARSRSGAAIPCGPSPP